MIENVHNQTIVRSSLRVFLYKYIQKFDGHFCFSMSITGIDAFCNVTKGCTAV